MQTGLHGRGAGRAGRHLWGVHRRQSGGHWQRGQPRQDSNALRRPDRPT